MGSAVELSGVGRRYGEVQALASTSLKLEAGSFTTVVGPSGCGKSTMLDIIAGLNRGYSGEVLIDGNVSTGPRREIGIIFQEAALLPWRTILDNAAFALEARGVAKDERRDTARRVLERVGLQDFADHYPHQLSGGMKQRTAIARVLATKPDLILADEPFGALDEQTRITLGFELLDVVEQTGASVFFITHSIQEALLLSDRILVMSARPGRIILDAAIDLPKGPDAARLSSPLASDLQEEIWKLLSTEATSSMGAQG